MKRTGGYICKSSHRGWQKRTPDILQHPTQQPSFSAFLQNVLSCNVYLLAAAVNSKAQGEDSEKNTDGNKFHDPRVCLLHFYKNAREPLFLAEQYAFYFKLKICWQKRGMQILADQAPELQRKDTQPLPQAARFHPWAVICNLLDYSNSLVCNCRFLNATNGFAYLKSWGGGFISAFPDILAYYYFFCTGGAPPEP